jgi:large subunit ribosomal protein L28
VRVEAPGGPKKPDDFSLQLPARLIISPTLFLERQYMARICELTGKGPRKGSIIWRSGKSKKSGGIGTHVTAITKRKFYANIQRVKALLPSGEVRYMRVAASALKKGLVTKAPKRTWKKETAAAKA